LITKPGTDQDHKAGSRSRSTQILSSCPPKSSVTKRSPVDNDRQRHRDPLSNYACQTEEARRDRQVTIRPRCAGVCTGSAVLCHRGRRSALPKDSFMFQPTTPPGPPTARPRTAASAVVAARLSDAEAKAVRLDCHDHRRRRAIRGWAMTNQTRSQLRSRRQPGSPHESPTLRSGSRSLRRSASALPVAASPTGSSRSTSGHRS
jgi:hypothetical protein